MRGDLLAKLGRSTQARAEFERAASLTRNSRERTLLLDRAAACATPGGDYRLNRLRWRAPSVPRTYTRRNPAYATAPGAADVR